MLFPKRKLLLPDIIADENIDIDIIQYLRDKGVHVISIFEDFRGLSDSEIIDLVEGI